MEDRLYFVRLFGPFEMRKNDGELVSFPARTAAATIAYLAIKKGRPVSRKSLAQEFWPEHDHSAAMTSLRTALHRVKKSLPRGYPIIAEGETLRLDPAMVGTDLDESERLHRTFLLAANRPDGLDAFRKEWQIRRRTLLEGWEFEWLDELRPRMEIEAAEVGGELAKHLEANGDLELAAETWREVLTMTPHHAEALQHAIRLEFQLKGKAGAMVLAKTAVDNYRSDLGIEMPKELQKMVKAIQSNALEVIPKPDLIRTRSELLLLARMFESSLKANRTEALSLLAHECAQPAAMAHPRTTLSLLTLALDQTDGASEERIAVAAQTTTIASWSSEFEVGHRWSDFVLANTTPESIYHGQVLNTKGFMFFEQRRYDEAKAFIQRSTEAFQKQGQWVKMWRTKIGMAGIQWHLLDFEGAKKTYLEVIREIGDSDEDEIVAAKSVAHGNLSFVCTVQQQWETAVEHGRHSLAGTDRIPVGRVVFPIPLGLGLVALGERKEGLDFLIAGVSGTLREGMLRFNQIAVDYAALAFKLLGREDVARCVIHANADHRAILQHSCSPAEANLIRDIMSIDPDNVKIAKNPLKGQSAGTLSQWVCEELERLTLATN